MIRKPLAEADFEAESKWEWYLLLLNLFLRLLLLQNPACRRRRLACQRVVLILLLVVLGFSNLDAIFCFRLLLQPHQPGL